MTGSVKCEGKLFQDISVESYVHHNKVKFKEVSVFPPHCQAKVYSRNKILINGRLKGTQNLRNNARSKSL